MPHLSRRFWIGRTYTSIALQSGANSSIFFVAPRPETFETYGNLYREQAEIERANEYYKRAARAYGEAGISLTRELLEERALLSFQVRDFRAAQTLIDRLISARPFEKDERGFYTASLTRGRILAAQGEFGQADEALNQALEYFHASSGYYTKHRQPWPWLPVS